MRIQRRFGRCRIGLAMLLMFSIFAGEVTVLQPAIVQAATEGTILASTLYVRSGPGTSYSKMTVNGEDVYLTKNTVVQILGEEDGWYRIVTTFGGRSVTGYVSGRYVSAEEAAQTPTATPVATKKPETTTTQTQTGAQATEFSVAAQIWVSELNIRETPGTSGTCLDTLKRGASVTAIGQTYVGTEKWYKVTYTSSGKQITGYAYGPYVTLNAPIPTATPKPTAAPTAFPSGSETTYAEEFSVPARVIASEVNIRSGAGTSNSIITSLKYGASVTATGILSVGTENWYRITFDYNGTKKVGYAYGPYIALSGAIPTATPTPKPTETPKPTATPVPAVDGAITDYRIPATVIATRLNVRAQAGTDKEILAVLVNTAKVTATGSCYLGADKWYCIEFSFNGSTKIGYVFGEYLQLSAAEPTKTPTQKVTETPTPEVTSALSYAFPARVTATQLNLRSDAGTENEVLALLTQGNELTVIGETRKGLDKWYQVKFGTTTGYVLSDFVGLDYAVYPDAILTEQVRLRSAASKSASYVKTEGGALAVLPTDTVVSLTGEQTAGDGKWFAISCEWNGETVKGFAQAAAVTLGKPAEVTPTVTPTPTATLTPTPSPEPTPTPSKEPTVPSTPTVTPSATTAPSGEVMPTASPMPTTSPTPAATPAAEAKENTAGVQDGWGHAKHPSASAMVLKILPASGVSSVKTEENARAITVTGETYLMLYGRYVDEDGNLYRHVGVEYRNKEYYGYILDKYITECEAPPTPTPTPSIDIWGNQTGGYDVSADFELFLSNQQFPDSYKPYLRELHIMYPNWIFKAYHTGLVWDTAVAEENIPGKNLIPNSSGIEWKSLEEGAYNWKTDSFIVYDGSTWVTASKAALEYYMDPRNFLDDKSIFQFEVLTYEPSYQNLTGVENILKYTPFYKNSYLYEDENGQVQSILYSETFLKAAQYSGVSPYHLATRVKQEVVTGTTTVSNSVTGTVSGLEGLYNFYNIGAYHSTQAGGAIANGLKYAKYGSSTDDALNDASLIPWDNRYRAIVGGAYIIGSSYINRGQNTIYLQKFNMTSYYTYSHQYMANVVAPSSEGKKTAQAYVGATDSPIVFSIPVYLNMPSEACSEPKSALNPNNYLSKLSVEAVDGMAYQLTPSFDGAKVESYSLIVDNSVEVVMIKATPVSKKAVVSGDGYYSLNVGANEFTVYVIAEDGSLREYKLYVVRE